MQKMIFSAVALVAFSFAGMANEIEEKKIELKPKPKFYRSITLQYTLVNNTSLYLKIKSCT